MKSIFIICLFVLSQQITLAQDADKIVSITVSGSGKTQDDAKPSALRSAIEQAFGTFIYTSKNSCIKLLFALSISIKLIDFKY